MCVNAWRWTAFPREETAKCQQNLLGGAYKGLQQKRPAEQCPKWSRWDRNEEVKSKEAQKAYWRGKQSVTHFCNTNTCVYSV